MTYVITEKCISCHRCLRACPTDAVETDGSTFWINADRCNDCQGSYGVAQCWAACPTNGGCVPLTEPTSISLSTKLETSTDYWSTWFETFNQRVARLKASQHADYWQNWFDTYSKALQNLQAHAQDDANVSLAP